MRVSFHPGARDPGPAAMVLPTEATRRSMHPWQSSGVSSMQIRVRVSW